jgi:hypothetical protein
MKKTLTVISLLAGAVSGYSQGAIAFNEYTTTLRQAVYNLQPAAYNNTTVTYGNYTVSETLGSSTAAIQTKETPPGTTAYQAGTALSGSAFSAELLVGPAGITSISGTAGGVGLLPWGGSNGIPASVAGFKTGANSIGMISSSAGVTLPTETYYAVGDTVSVAIAAWNNENGTITSLLAAQQGGTPWGIGNVVQATGGLTGPPNAAEPLPAGLESFSLGVTTPEPSTIALGVMGVSALLFRRRK